jgi:hypothetical protein
MFGQDTSIGRLAVMANDDSGSGCDKALNCDSEDGQTGLFFLSGLDQELDTG